MTQQPYPQQQPQYPAPGQYPVVQPPGYAPPQYVPQGYPPPASQQQAPQAPRPQQQEAQGISADAALMGGGKSAPAWKFGEPGTRKVGTIKSPPKARQEREYQKDNPGGGPLKFFPSGDPIMGVTVELSTQERDPQDSEDDGTRTFFVEGQYLRAAVREAVQATGESGLRVGGVLDVTFTHREEPMDTRSRKFWQVVYTAPGNASLMAAPPAQAPAYAPPAAQAPAQYPPAAIAFEQPQPPAPALHPPAGSFSQPPADVPQAAAEPVRPPAVPEVVWNSLSPQAKAETAAAVPAGPPF